MNQNSRFRSFLGGLPRWAAWSLAVLVGAAVTTLLVGLMMLFDAFYYFLGEARLEKLPAALILGATDGALGGLLQWFVLRRFLARSWRWILATFIGTNLGWCALVFIPGTDWSMPRDSLAQVIYIVAVTRIMASLFQGWLLWGVQGTFIWIAAALVGWGMADAAAVILSRDSSLPLAAAITAAGLVGCLITACAVVWVFDHSEQRPYRTAGAVLLTALLIAGFWGINESVFSQQVRSLTGQNGFLTSVTFSPDGSRLASASEDGSVFIWQVNSWQVEQTIEVNRLDPPGHMSTGNDVERVMFSPDGRLIATASYDGSVEVWAPTGEKLLDVRSMVNRSPCMVFSPDSSLLAVSGGDYPEANLQVWDIASRSSLQTLDLADKTIISGMAFTAGSQPTWLNYSDGSLTWETEGGTKLEAFSDPWLAVTCSGKSALFPDGLQLASGGGDEFKDNVSAVTIWDLKSWTRTQSMPGPGVKALALSADGRILAVGRNYKYSLLLWDTVNWQEIRQLQGGNNISAAAFSPDGSLLATGSLDGVVRLWQVPAVP